MKKLLYFVASMLCLSIIFAAGWASSAEKRVEPATDMTREAVEENTDDGDDHDRKCPECPQKDLMHHRRTYKFKLPCPYINSAPGLKKVL